jgi:hypothetical protein
MRASVVIGLVTGFLLSTEPLLGTEALYPPNNDILGRYVLSADTLGPSQILTISRTIVNRTNFDLGGLYFSDNFPPAFSIVGQRASINGREIGCGVVGPLRDHEVKGRDAYFWIIDSRGEIPGIGEVVASGDSVRLEVDVRCGEWGRFLLPAHAAAFSNDGYGYFSTSDTMQVVIDVRTDAGGRAPAPSALRSRAYPNPFNATVVITYDGLEAPAARIDLEVFDPLGRLVHADRDLESAERGAIFWRPDRSLGSGVYLYRISAGHRQSSGKILLVR